jgi:uncharacterized protein (DUF2336 family)
MIHSMSQISHSENAQGNRSGEGLTGKTTVLRALTDLFCLRPEPGDEEIVRFSELALRILPEANDSTKIYVASKLARHAHAPPAVLSSLIRADRTCALLIYEHALNLSLADQIGGARHRDLQCVLAVARRKGVSGEITEALIMRREPDIIAALVNNESATFSRSGIERIALFARHDVELVAKFSARAEEPLVSAQQFLRSSTLERMRLIASARRQHLGRPSERASAATTLILSLRESAQTRNWDAFAQTLADELGWEREVVAPLLNDEGGEPLALMLCITGMPMQDAIRIFLCCDVPIAHSYSRVRALSDLVRDTPALIALEMMEAATGRMINKPKLMRAPVLQTPVRDKREARPRQVSRDVSASADEGRSHESSIQEPSRQTSRPEPTHQESFERGRPTEGVRPPRVKAQGAAASTKSAVLLRRGA